MKKAFVIAIIVILCLASNSYAQTLSRAFLYSNSWNTDQDSLVHGYYTLQFNNDNTWNLECLTPGIVSYASGTYSIETGKHLTTTTLMQSYLPDQLTEKIMKWSIAKEEKSLFFSIKLISATGVTFMRSGTPPPIDSLRSVDGISVLTTNHEMVKLIRDIKIKGGPGSDYDEYRFEYEGERFTIFKEGTEIMLLARTLEKVKMVNEYNYWYYCDLITLSWGTMGPRQGWIWGGDIQAAP